MHYRATMGRDFIPYRDKEGAAGAKDTIITLKSDENASWHDHDFMSPTYAQAITDEFKGFIERYDK